MPEERKISPAVVIGIGVGIGIAAIGIYVLSRAAPPTPPEGYICPYCGASFPDLPSLQEHIINEHPGERIPIEIEWE